MVPNRKLAIFDIDGTIAIKSVVPQEVIEGLKHIQSLGYLTTVSTGRSYRRVRDAFGDAFNDIVSNDALIIVEHGTKIVHKNGTVVQADYFGSAEVDHFVDFIQSNEDMVRFCTFALPNPEQKLKLWVKDVTDLEQIQEERGYYAEVFTCSYEELKDRMSAEQISHFLVKLQDFIKVENLKLRFTRSNMDLIFMDAHMQFVGNLSDKAKAIAYLEQFHEIEVKNMLIAGNGINDVDMLNLVAGKRILVGTEETAPTVLGHLQNHDSVMRVESPKDLGIYLSNLVD